MSCFRIKRTNCYEGVLHILMHLNITPSETGNDSDYSICCNVTTKKEHPRLEPSSETHFSELLRCIRLDWEDRECGDNGDCESRRSDEEEGLDGVESR